MLFTKTSDCKINFNNLKKNYQKFTNFTIKGTVINKNNKIIYKYIA